ncbi:DUF1993 domain-containing protein [soil metagenome]
MALSLYQATIAQYLQLLPAAIANLDRAEAWAGEQGISANEMLGKRVAPDMWPLATQVRQVALHSAGAVKGATAGAFSPDLDQGLYDFATLRALLTDAIAYLEGVEETALDAIAGKEVAFSFGGQVRMRFSVEDFLLSFSQPNFYFHASMIYAILRGLGVSIGKRDFLGTPRISQPA